MSEENVKTVLDLIAAYNRGDMDSFFEFFDPEIEWHDLPEFPGGGVHQGMDDFRRHVEDYREAWAETRIENEEVRSVGDRVVTRGQYTGVGEASGISAANQPASAVYDFREGRILRVRQFVDHAEALEAAGLRE